jgi:hypothetical protein
VVGDVPTIDEVSAALDAGHSVADIAWSAGCSARSVRNVAHRGGLALPRARQRAHRADRLADSAWLREQLGQPGASITAVASLLGTEIANVRQALAAAGVAAERKRPPRYPQLYEPGWLADRFAHGASLRLVAGELGCSLTAVRRAAALLDPPRRAFGQVSFPQLRDTTWLHRRYVEQGQSSTEIAAELGCGSTSVLRALHAANIAVRPGQPPQRFRGSVTRRGCAAATSAMGPAPPTSPPSSAARPPPSSRRCTGPGSRSGAAARFRASAAGRGYGAPT